MQQQITKSRIFIFTSQEETENTSKVQRLISHPASTIKALVTRMGKIA